MNAKGKKIKAAMQKEYSQSDDGKKAGEKVFYASENKGSIKGVTKSTKRKDK